ncbi:hypothetical protein ELQ39_32275 [Streptomyces sp. GB4-14]|uniref:hypothetical protein n=1 Tax=Streptomyces TaxID=1883 RepID=UPI001F5FAC47|nr:hypothetical protein [Streptomyces sp. GB4-14]
MTCAQGHDALTPPHLGHHHVRVWRAEVDGWIRLLVEHRSACRQGAPFAGRGRGEITTMSTTGADPVWETAIAAGAAGLAVGVVGGMAQLTMNRTSRSYAEALQGPRRPGGQR